VSGEGRPAASAVDASGLSLGIVATRWHTEVVESLLARAIEAARACGIESPTVVRIAGAVELPVIAQQLAVRHDAVVCLGAVIRGGTPHFEYVCEAVTAGLGRVALDAATPVGNGVLTCDTLAQAWQRCGLPDSSEDPHNSEDKGWEATVAALESALVLRELRHHRGAVRPGSGRPADS
jgi:6,7-dimethyl-8-ribityllumazine synthase